jgi:uncharacterized protein
VLRDDARSKSHFHRVFAAPDDPIAIDEAEAIALVILGPATPHAGRGAGKSAATDAVTDTLMRCRPEGVPANPPRRTPSPTR